MLGMKIHYRHNELPVPVERLMRSDKLQVVFTMHLKAHHSPSLSRLKMLTDTKLGRQRQSYTEVGPDR